MVMKSAVVVSRVELAEEEEKEEEVEESRSEDKEQERSSPQNRDIAAALLLPNPYSASFSPGPQPDSQRRQYHPGRRRCVHRCL